MDTKKTEKLYVVLVNTPGIFATLIRVFLGFEFIHVILGFEKNLEHCYSFGRRYPQIPILSGFEREELEKVQKKFKNTRIAEYEIDVTPEQRRKVIEKVKEFNSDRFKYKYAIVGIPFAALGIPFHQKHHYTCSQFVAKTLQDTGIRTFDKHYSLLTPKDLYHMPDKKLLYVGSLKNFLQKKKG